MGDGFPGADWELFENLPQPLQGMEAWGSDSIDSGGHVEFAINDNPEVLGMGGGSGCRS